MGSKEQTMDVMILVKGVTMADKESLSSGFMVGVSSGYCSQIIFQRFDRLVTVDAVDLSSSTHADTSDMKSVTSGSTSWDEEITTAVVL